MIFYQNSALQSGNTRANDSQGVDQSQESVSAIGSYQTDATKGNTSPQVNIYNFSGEIGEINLNREFTKTISQNKINKFSFVEKLKLRLRLDKLLSLFK